MTVSTERISTLKRKRGGLAIDKKKCVLKLRKDVDRKRLFYSKVSKLLSMGKLEAFADYLLTLDRAIMMNLLSEYVETESEPSKLF